jgi:hypothetical protein
VVVQACDILRDADPVCDLFVAGSEYQKRLIALQLESWELRGKHCPNQLKLPRHVPPCALTAIRDQAEMRAADLYPRLFSRKPNLAN